MSDTNHRQVANPQLLSTVRSSISFIVRVGSVFLLTATIGQAQDYVWPALGGMMSGKIQSVTAEGLTIKQKDGVKKVSVDEITKHRFGGEPSGLTKVRTSIRDGQFEEASRSLSRLKSQGSGYAKQDIEFYKAMIQSRLALRGEGDVTAAARLVKRFINGNENSLHYYEACQIMGDLAMNLGKFSAASKSYAAMTASKSKNVAARGNLLQGDALFLQNKPKEATQKYRQAQSAKDSSLKALAQVGEAKCQAAAGNHASAIKSIEKLIADNPSDKIELFARAHNALGFAYQKAGNSNAALESYLYTDLLFYRETAQHAEALYHLGKLWSVVNKPVESTRARKMLKEKYAASLWAKK